MLLPGRSTAPPLRQPGSKGRTAAPIAPRRGPARASEASPEESGLASRSLRRGRLDRCCNGDVDFQSKLSESTLKKLKSLCTEFQIAYQYTDLAIALNGFAGI